LKNDECIIAYWLIIFQDRQDDQRYWVIFPFASTSLPIFPFAFWEKLSFRK